MSGGGAGGGSNVNSLIQKLADQQGTPEERAAMDASIREARRSVIVRQMIAEVQEAQRAGRSADEIRDASPRWKEEYPKLFEMVLDPGCSQAMLTAMLAQLEAVEAGQRSTHLASTVVGTMLANSYVRPRLGMEPMPLPDSATQPARLSGQSTGGSRRSGGADTKRD
jgi:hypothetical protein